MTEAFKLHIAQTRWAVVDEPSPRIRHTPHKSDEDAAQRHIQKTRYAVPGMVDAPSPAPDVLTIHWPAR